jgi:hypothetical protein
VVTKLWAAGSSQIHLLYNDQIIHLALSLLSFRGLYAYVLVMYKT